jgi:phospholipid/cholesterol/gamma-HCH transport system substrate-binding protein
MKFKIRFADQIVGLLIITALVSLVGIIFIIGSKQRWFDRDYSYKTYLASASGLSANMAVLYKGFTIGHIKSFILTEDDEVEVVFSIYDNYVNRVREGSLIQFNVSPIGLGNQFIFYPGFGEEILSEGAHIPSVESPQGQTFIQLGLARLPARNDSISNLFTQVSAVLTDLDGALVQLREGFDGDSGSSLGRTMGGLESTLGGVNEFVGDLNAALGPLLASVNEMAANLNTLSGELSDPDGLLSTVLDTDGTVYASLEASLKSVSGLLSNLDKTSALLPAQAAGLLAELRRTLKSAEDVLTALTNNPLLRGGVPAPVRNRSGGTNPRDISF